MILRVLMKVSLLGILPSLLTLLQMVRCSSGGPKEAFVGSFITLAEMPITEYEAKAGVSKQLKQMQEQYIGVRPVLDDGNSMIRSIIFGWLEQVAERSAEERTQIYQSLKQRILKLANFRETFGEEITTIVPSFKAYFDQMGIQRANYGDWLAARWEANHRSEDPSCEANEVIKGIRALGGLYLAKHWEAFFSAFHDEGTKLEELQKNLFFTMNMEGDQQVLTVLSNLLQTTIEMIQLIPAENQSLRDYMKTVFSPSIEPTIVPLRVILLRHSARVYPLYMLEDEGEVEERELRQARKVPGEKAQCCRHEKREGGREQAKKQPKERRHRPKEDGGEIVDDESLLSQRVLPMKRSGGASQGASFLVRPPSGEERKGETTSRRETKRKNEDEGRYKDEEHKRWDREDRQRQRKSEKDETRRQRKRARREMKEAETATATATKETKEEAKERERENRRRDVREREPVRERDEVVPMMGFLRPKPSTGLPLNLVSPSQRAPFRDGEIEWLRRHTENQRQEVPPVAEGASHSKKARISTTSDGQYSSYQVLTGGAPVRERKTSEKGKEGNQPTFPMKGKSDKKLTTQDAMSIGDSKIPHRRIGEENYGKNTSKDVSKGSLTPRLLATPQKGGTK